MAEISSITREFVLKTDGITYLEVVTVTYDDESQDITKRPIGTAAQLAADQADKIIGRTREIVTQAQRISFAKRDFAEILATDSSITTLTGASPLKVIQDRHQAELLKTGWTIDEGAGFVPLAFTVNAQGVLRYSVNGGANKTERVFGDAIRLNNYPSAPVDTDFYLSENGGRYFSLPNRNVVIKTP